MQENEKTHKVIICGAGPGGLSSAASLIKEASQNPLKQFDIDIFEQRKDYQRGQKVVYYGRALEDDVKWDTFLFDLFYPDSVIRIDSDGKLLCNGEAFPLPLNKRQTLLKNIVSQSEDSNVSEINFSIKALESALKEHLEANNIKNINLKFHGNTAISDVDLEKQTISAIQNEENATPKDFPFDTLILCEGAKGKLVDKINTKIEKGNLQIDPFTFEEIGKNIYFGQDSHINNTIYYPFHFVARLKLKEGLDFHTMEKKKTDPNEHLGQFKEYGWPPVNFSFRQHQIPTYRLDDNLWKANKKDWGLKIFAAGEIPEHIHRIQDKKQKQEAILKWASVLASQQYNIPENSFEIDNKGNVSLNSNTFFLDIKSVDNPVRELPTGGHVVLLGDRAQRSTHESGLGTTTALNEGRVLAECLVSEDEDRFGPYTDRFESYKDFLWNFVIDNFHRQLFLSMPHDSTTEVSSFFPEKKDPMFLLRHLSVNKSEYTLNSQNELNRLGFKPTDKNNSRALLFEKIAYLEKLSTLGNDFASYTLATELENTNKKGASYTELQKGQINLKPYEDLNKSLAYWELLDKKGYRVSRDIQRVKKKILEKKTELEQPTLERFENLSFYKPAPDNTNKRTIKQPNQNATTEKSFKKP